MVYTMVTGALVVQCARASAVMLLIEVPWNILISESDVLSDQHKSKYSAIE